MKKFAVLMLALVLTLSCCAALADSTYTHFYPTEELAGVTDLNGFITGSGMTEMNTLVLKDDGTYEYTKLLGTITDAGEVTEITTENGTMRYEVSYVYTGSYTQEGDQVTMNVPEECVFSEDWGILETMGYLKNSAGMASKGDRVVNYEGTDYDPWDNFGSPVYKFAGHDAAVSVTVNADGTFTYNVAANSDDD